MCFESGLHQNAFHLRALLAEKLLEGDLGSRGFVADSLRPCQSRPLQVEFSQYPPHMAVRWTNAT